MKAIIFDADGVLIGGKDEHGNYRWHKTIEADLGLTPDHMRQLFSAEWASILKGHLDTKQHFTTVFAALNIALPVDTFIDYWLTHDATINTELISMLPSIKGFNLHMGTNQDKYRTAFIQKTFGPYFDRIFSSYHLGAIKPEPAFFRYIETALNLQPADIAFIDDSKSHVEAAAALGWTCHHYQNIEGLKHFIKTL
jgi:HAD superfamily hydrolase (TIGR01509 family)